jgi:hypothetical protein
VVQQEEQVVQQEEQVDIEQLVDFCFEEELQRPVEPKQGEVGGKGKQVGQAEGVIALHCSALNCRWAR